MPRNTESSSREREIEDEKIRAVDEEALIRGGTKRAVNEKGKRLETLDSQLLTDYIKRNKIPEPSEEEASIFPDRGWVIKYAKSGLVQRANIDGLMIDPEDLPIAIGYVGIREVSEQ